MFCFGDLNLQELLKNLNLTFLIDQKLWKIVEIVNHTINYVPFVFGSMAACLFHHLNI